MIFNEIKTKKNGETHVGCSFLAMYFTRAEDLGVCNAAFRHNVSLDLAMLPVLSKDEIHTT